MRKESTAVQDNKNCRTGADQSLSEAVERIARMEEDFDALLIAAAQDPGSIGTDPVLGEKLRKLKSYYEGGGWLADYLLDEQGMLPQTLKRGVLSQDGVHDLLCALRMTQSQADRESGTL